MLKNYGYGGAYRDDNISVSVLLENPLEYGLEANTMVFSVTLNARNSETAVPRFEDFTFHIMDEASGLHSTKSVAFLESDTATISEDGEPIRKPDGLIVTTFNHEFLFQDLRVAFAYLPYGKTNVIELSH